MEKYIESYGAAHNKLLFYAVRFRKPIVKIQFTKQPEKINTNNILVIYTKNFISSETNTLTFWVGAKEATDGGIFVEKGLESELLLALLNKCNIYYSTYYKNILYICTGIDAIMPVQYKTISKTASFKALYKITMAHRKRCLNFEHIILCKFFRRNNLKWEKWNSWWYFVQNLMNDFFKTKMSKNITLQAVAHFKKVWKNSISKNMYCIKKELYFCEIAMENTQEPGILCFARNSTITYVSPMIVGKEWFSFLPISDLNNIACNVWLPLYTDKNQWFRNVIYFYVKNYKENIKYIENILLFLKNTTVEKYKWIQENVFFIQKLLNCKGSV